MSTTAIRLEIAEDDHHIIDLKPFDALTVEEHIRLFEAGSDEETDAEYMQRALLLPQRFARVMRRDETERVASIIAQWHAQNNGLVEAMRKVSDSLSDFENANGRPWSFDDAKAIMEAHGVFRSSITIEGRTFAAPDRIDIESTAGQWADLEDALNVDEEAPKHQRETESATYVKALAILMREVNADGSKQMGYPAQGKDESDDAFAERLGQWIMDRRALFMRAPWIEVMGCAAFFFAKSNYCALYTSRRWSLFRGLLRPPMPQAPKGTRAAMEGISSFVKQQGTT